MILLLLSFFVFLFFLYTICRDDFVLLRKNLSLERVFNFAFLTSLVALVVSRIIYVALHFNNGYLNPLVFFLFPYFPGLSVIGGIIGGVLFILFFSKIQKMPSEHLLDCFSLPFLPTISLALLLNLFQAFNINKPLIISSYLINIIVYLILFVIFFKSFQKAKLRDGSLSILTVLTFSFFSLFIEVMRGGVSAILKENETYLLLLTLVISIFLIFYQEGLLFKKLKNRLKIGVVKP